MFIRSNAAPAPILRVVRVCGGVQAKLTVRVIFSSLPHPSARCFNRCHKAPLSSTIRLQLGPECTSQSGENMKTRTILLTLLLGFVGVAVCFAADAFMGTWKLNEAKSKIAAGSPKTTTLV